MHGCLFYVTCQDKIHILGEKIDFVKIKHFSPYENVRRVIQP